MLIGKLAKETQLTASRIRFYESIGLIQSTRKRNGYRVYTPVSVMILNMITHAQAAGFSLDEIRNIMPTNPTSDWQHDRLLLAIRNKIIEIEMLEQRLAKTKVSLLSVIQCIENKPDTITCAENLQQMFGQHLSEK